MSSVKFSTFPFAKNLPPVKQLYPGILRVLGQNPSFLTLQGTNSYILRCGVNSKENVIIDTSAPGVTAYVKNMVDVIKSFGRKSFVRDIILTHWHKDHVGAALELQEALTLDTGTKPNILKFPSEMPHDTINFTYSELHDGDYIDLGHYGKAKVFHMPGHTDDHICLYIPSYDTFLTGDMILGEGSSTFEYLHSYMKSLSKAKEISTTLKTMLPAHGEVISNPSEKTEQYIQHRIGRIKEVFEYLVLDAWLSENVLVDGIYLDISEKLKPSALTNLRQSLIYLKKQGLVESKLDESKTSDPSVNVKDHQPCLWRKTTNDSGMIKYKFD